MKWFQLLASLLPVIEGIFKAIEDALASGKAPAVVHQAVVDHVAELPAVIRGT